MNGERVIIAVLLVLLCIQSVVTGISIGNFKAAEKLFRENCGAKQTLIVQRNSDTHLGSIASTPPMMASVCCGAEPPANYFEMLRNIPQPLLQFYGGLIVAILAVQTVIRIRRGR